MLLLTLQRQALYKFLLLENCAEYWLNPELEPEPESFQCWNRNRNKSLRFHYTALNIGLWTLNSGLFSSRLRSKWNNGLWTLGPQIADSGQWTADSEQWTADSEQWTADSKQWIADSEQWTADSEKWTADSEQWTADSVQWTADREQWTDDSEPRTAKIKQWIADCHHIAKKVSDFPVPSRDVTNQTLPGQE
jgi:hypothetical protein